MFSSFSFLRYSKTVLKKSKMECFILFVSYLGVRAMQIVRHVRALSVWRESVLSAVQTVHLAPALRPQPSQAPHPANTPIGKVNVVHSSNPFTDKVHKSSPNYLIKITAQVK